VQTRDLPGQAVDRRAALLISFRSAVLLAFQLALSIQTNRPGKPPGLNRPTDFAFFLYIR
jgi:hypothetical protein